MERRKIAQALFATGVGASLVAARAKAQTCTDPCFTRTSAEKAAKITPANPQYPPLNVLRYGAVINSISSAGTTTTAIQNAINVAIAGGGGVVYLPPGKYYVNSALMLTGHGGAAANGVTIQGAGQNSTAITMTVANQTGIMIGNAGTICLNCFIQDLTVEGSISMTGGSAIRFMNGGNCGVANVRFGYNLYWAISLDAAGPLTVNDTQEQGGYSYYVSNCEINACVIGIVLGQTHFVQDVFLNGLVIDGATGQAINLISASGVYLSQVSTANCGIGIQTSPPSGMNVNAVFCDQVLSDTTVGSAWNITTNGGQVVEFMMTDCWGCGAGKASGGSIAAHGVSIDQGSGTINGIKISGGVFHNNNAAGIAVVSATNLVIQQAQVNQNSMYGAAGRYPGIVVKGGVSNFVIANNICGSGGYFAAVNVQPNLQSHGIVIEAGPSNNYVVAGNLVAGNLNTPGVSDGGTGTSKSVNNNVG
jgi:hypothetical protein